MERAVIALGGNALSPPGQKGDIAAQFRYTAQTATVLVDLLNQGVLPVITHGNGPQVGELLRRIEASMHVTYPLPLDTCVADTMGGMGYMIQQCVSSELLRRGREKTITTLISRSLVDENDPALEAPSKPIGPFYSREEARRFRDEQGWNMVEDAGRGYRRVVCSPRPLEILEIDAIRRLVSDEQLVVTCGGGGVPVVKGESGYRGVEAVIDKDRASSLLARQLGADRFVISTDVPGVYVNYDSPRERLFRILPVDRAETLLERGEFAEGSMRPKVESAVSFVRETEREALIGALDNLREMLAGESGTRILPGGEAEFYNRGATNSVG